MDIYERESGYFDGKRIPGLRYDSYFYAKGLYYLKMQSDSAKVYFQKCLDMSESVKAKLVLLTDGIDIIGRSINWIR